MPPRRSGGLEGQRGHNIQSDDIEQPLLDEEDDAKTPPARPKRKTVIQEACDILYLAGPIFIAMFSWVGMKTTDTALLGHVGTEKLSASALSDLWTTSTGVFVQGRVLGMFCGQAFGAGNKPLAGIWLQVSLAVLFVIGIPVIALWGVSYFVFHDLFKEGQQISKDAAYFSLVLAACIPARIMYSQITQFFSAQRIMFPSVACSIAGLVTNVVLGVIFVLGIPPESRDDDDDGVGARAGSNLTRRLLRWAGPEHVDAAVVIGDAQDCAVHNATATSPSWVMLASETFGDVAANVGDGGGGQHTSTHLLTDHADKHQWFAGYGFIACPIVTCCVEWVMLIMLIVVFWWYKGLYKDCWPASGWSMTHVTWKRVWVYMRFYVPSALAIASDFWRVSVIGIFAARMGSDDLAVFNTSYRILWICIILAGSLAGASSIKLGIAFGSGDASQAKYVASVGSLLTVSILSLLGVLVALFSKQLGQIFSNDPVILDLFHAVRLPLAVMMVAMNMAVFLEKIIMSMGRPKLILVLNLIGSWGGQVPWVWGLTTYHQRLHLKPLAALFWGAAAGYAMLVVMFVAVIATTDWAKYAKEAQARSEVKAAPPPPAEHEEVENDDDALLIINEHNQANTVDKE
eukprot:m.1137133 g.1137133  ORF g.1137133 m.1137133 type:complete len:629 (-) comp24434_c3_seq9:170-2056(-)